MIRLKSYVIAFVCLIMLSSTYAQQPSSADGPQDLNPLLEPIRNQYHLPALAAAVIIDNKIVALGATGLRKIGTDINVTVDDQFHLGSCTKAMTATLSGILVEQGKLKWQTTLKEAFPDMLNNMHPDYHDVTLEQLLSHRAGLPGADQSWPTGKSFMDIHKLPGEPMQQRLEYTKLMLCQPPVAKPGTQFIYSNAGYAIAGAMAERAVNKPWETLMQEMIFDPLDMKTAGFGAMGTPDKIDQPWQHQTVKTFLIKEELKAVTPGPYSDNPPAIGPAGTVHCSIKDWAQFIMIHLQGEKEDSKLLTQKTIQELHAPTSNGDYALGWGITNRDWAGGRALTHAGSNNMNFSVVWMAPERNFAVLVVSNQGGGKVDEACDKAAGALINTFLQNKD